MRMFLTVKAESGISGVFFNLRDPLAASSKSMKNHGKS